MSLSAGSTCPHCKVQKLTAAYASPPSLLAAAQKQRHIPAELLFWCVECLCASEEWMTVLAEKYPSEHALLQGQHEAQDEARKFDVLESAVPLGAQTSRANLVCIAFLDSRRIEVALPASGTVRDLKHAVANALGIPPRGMRLLLDGRELRDRSGSLEEQGVAAGAQLAGIIALSRHAGQNRIEGATRDQYGNAAGSEYDLTVDNAFKGMTVAVLNFCNQLDFSSTQAALVQKGFSVHAFNGSVRAGPRLSQGQAHGSATAPAVAELQRVLQRADVVELWLISDRTRCLSDAHLQVIEKFWDAGNGVYIWGDNDPFYADANALGQQLVGLSMFGDKCGMGKVLQVTASGTGVRQHEITTGIENMFEGVTVATVDLAMQNVPKRDSLGPFRLEEIIFGSERNVICVAYHDARGRRLIFDGGFTRLLPRYWSKTAGTARYVVNAAGWLVNFDD